MVKPSGYATEIILLLWCRCYWYCGVVVITTAQLHSTKPELKLWTDSQPACTELKAWNDKISDNGPS